MATSDHHFTIAGKVWLWRYTRLRGQAAGWTYWPDSKNPKLRPRVLIDARLKGRTRMETELHEGLHAAFPHLSEEAVTETAADIARILYSIGYRLVEPS